MRLGGEIDQETFASKQTQLRDRLASVKLQLDILDRSQWPTQRRKFLNFRKLLSANGFRRTTTKRRILEIVFLNCRLDGVALFPSIKKPFDALVEGLISKNSRGERI
jgi:site-specific DNA recombinase